MTDTPLSLGAFSLSLSVADLGRSQAFYETLGFQIVGGDASQGWLILRNPDDITLGLFQGMFKDNMMTFNPGWDRTAKPLDSFADVRRVQAHLKENGIEIEREIEKDSQQGPANFTVLDPDGNRILLDQHR